jgi:limonene-1,2-epoxide hydrolase
MSVVTRFVNACNRHDADSVAACLHPDFDSIQPMYPTRNFRGADQVRRNWQAIFDAEPGFRLTVLRQAAADDTVWLELHGAGREAEVAGVFVMGIQGDRVRWARIYSALVEPMPEGAPEGVTTSPATLREVPPLETSADGAPEPVEVGTAEDERVASVVDIDGGGRSRRRRSSRRRAQEPSPDPAVEGEAVAAGEPGPVEGSPVVEPVEPVEPIEPIEPIESVEPVEPVDMKSVEPVDMEPAVDVEPFPEPEVVDEAGRPVAEAEPEVMADAGEPMVMVVAEEPVVLLVADEPEPLLGAHEGAEPDEPDLVAPPAEPADPAEVTQEHDVLAALEAEEPADEPPAAVAAAAELLEEREPDVVAEPMPAPVVSEELEPDPEPEELVAPTRPGKRRGWKKR